MIELTKVKVLILIKVKGLKNVRYVIIFILLMDSNINLMFVMDVMILVWLYKIYVTFLL